MALWELEELQNPQFLGFIRSVPTPTEFLQPSLLPSRTIATLEYEYILGAGGEQVTPMAQVMTWDSEAPIAGRPPVPGPGATVRGELPPIKRKAQLSEKEIIKFRQPRPGTTERADVLDYVYDLSTKLVTAIQSRVEWMTMQALSEDRLKIDQEGIVVEVDFGIPVNQQWNVNTDTALTTWWTDTTNSNPVADLDYICNQYEVIHGFRPARAIVDNTSNMLLLQNSVLRDLIRGPGAPTIRLTQEELNALFEIYDLPALEPYNVSLLEEMHNGRTIPVRPFNRNRMVLLPPGGVEVGSVLFGPTAESRASRGSPTASSLPASSGTCTARTSLRVSGSRSLRSPSRPCLAPSTSARCRSATTSPRKDGHDG